MNMVNIGDKFGKLTVIENSMKGDMSTEELFEMCNKILNHANQQPSQPLTKLEGSETNS